MASELLAGMYRVMEGLGAAEKEISSTFLEETGFRKGLEDIGIHDSSFTIEKIQGKNILTNAGKPVDLPGAIKSIENYGDISGAMGSLGVPQQIIESESVKTYSSLYKKKWETQPGNIAIQEIKEISKTGDKIGAETGLVDPTNVTEIEQALKDNPRLNAKFNKKFDEFKSKVKSAKENGKVVKAGVWIKRGVFFGVGIITTAVLFNEILKHKEIINGCWLVDIRTGDKCKVSSLTCNISHKNETGYMCGKYNICGSDGLSPCFATTTCTKRTASGTCSETIGSCATGICHHLCSQDTILQVPSGKRLQCVNVNFWGAAEDFLGSTLTNVFGKNFLLYLGIFFGIVIIILILVR